LLAILARSATALILTICGQVLGGKILKTGLKKDVLKM
jgi:hypothetical protein